MRYAVVGILCLVVGAVGGYLISARGQISEERELFLLHEAYSRQAELSWKILQSLDADPPKLEELQRTAQAHVLVYVSEVHNLKGEGISWVPLQRQEFEQMRAYLDAHPFSQASGPNLSR